MITKNSDKHNLSHCWSPVKQVSKLKVNSYRHARHDKPVLSVSRPLRRCELDSRQLNTVADIVNSNCPIHTATPDTTQTGWFCRVWCGGVNWVGPTVRHGRSVSGLCRSMSGGAVRPPDALRRTTHLSGGQFTPPYQTRQDCRACQSTAAATQARQAATLSRPTAHTQRTPRKCKHAVDCCIWVNLNSLNATRRGWSISANCSDFAGRSRDSVHTTWHDTASSVFSCLGGGVNWALELRRSYRRWNFRHVAAGQKPSARQTPPPLSTICATVRRISFGSARRRVENFGGDAEKLLTLPSSRNSARKASWWRAALPSHIHFLITFSLALIRILSLVNCRMKRCTSYRVRHSVPFPAYIIHLCLFGCLYLFTVFFRENNDVMLISYP